MKKIISSMILGLIFLFTCSHASQLDDFLNRIQTCQKELEIDCNQLIRRVKILRSRGEFQSSEEFIELENLVLKIKDCLLRKQQVADMALKVEKRFEASALGYGNWLINNEINVQGFEADFEHYKECILFSVSRCLTKVKLKPYIEDMNNSVSLGWGRSWVESLTNLDIFEAYLNYFVKEQEEIDHQYLIPSIKEQISAHENWSIEN